MKIKYLGTAAAEGYPALFCECERCVSAKKLGGRNIRSRSQALIDDRLLIDFPADTFMHFIMHDVPMSKIKTCLITHSHSDHLYAADTEMRKADLAHIADDDATLTFYADKSGFENVAHVIDEYKIKELKAVLIKPFEPFEAEGYFITPVRACHDPKSSPVLYLIEKDGKSLFYSNDTGEYPKETFEFLKKRKTAIDLISLDCTLGCGDSGYPNHLTFDRCVSLINELKSIGVADEKTILVLNHFSHNGPRSVYDEFVPIARECGLLVSYDGMEIEF